MYRNKKTVSLILGMEQEQKQRSKKVLPVLYWGVDLNLTDVMEHSEIKSFLAKHPTLVPLKKIHSTLLFVGKTPLDPETSQKETPETYKMIDGQNCITTVTGFGYNDQAMALDVVSIKFKETSEDLPSNAVHQHITVALAPKAKAVDSVKTFNENVVKLSEPLVLSGRVKGFLF